MRAFLRSELFRLRRRRMLLVLVVFMLVLPAALYVLLYTSTQAQLEAIRSGRFPTQAGAPPPNVAQLEELLRSLRPDRVPEMALGLIQPIATIMLVVLAGSLTGNEYGWNTIRTVLAHGPRRAAFLGAKLLALVLASVGLVIVGFASVVAGSFGVSVVGGMDISVSADIAGRLVTSVGKTAYVVIPYIGFAVMVAVLARSAAAATGFGLVVYFGESLISGIALSLNRDLAPLFDAGISRNVSAITRTSIVVAGATQVPRATEQWLAAFILALYVVAFVALGIHRIMKRDLTLA